MLPGKFNGREGVFCAFCPPKELLQTRVILPPSDLAFATEEDLQRAIIVDLKERGLEVLQTTVRYRASPCDHCGKPTRSKGGYGASPGVPDLLVWVGGWKGLECKGLKTPVSDEQKRLAREGKIIIVRSLEEALAAVEGKP